MVNFVDHKTNYCRVFLAMTTDAASKQFEHFLTIFKKRFDSRIHVLKIDSGGEYQYVDLFYNNTSRNETNNQASNGTAQPIHRIIMHMTRWMISPCG